MQSLAQQRHIVNPNCKLCQMDTAPKLESVTAARGSAEHGDHLDRTRSGGDR
jgi:hypothetical protein